MNQTNDETPRISSDKCRCDNKSYRKRHDLELEYKKYGCLMIMTLLNEYNSQRSLEPKLAGTHIRHVGVLTRDRDISTSARHPTLPSLEVRTQPLAIDVNCEKLFPRDL